MPHFLIGLTLLLALAGCKSLPWKAQATADKAVSARVDQAWDIWVRLPAAQQPDEALRHKALEKGRAQLSARLDVLSRKPMEAWMARQPRYMIRLVERMGWTPVRIEAPAYAVQYAWSPDQKALEAQVELDWAALVAQLRERIGRIDEQLRCFRRVPDRVSHLRQLRALVPALPLLLERMQLRSLLWRFDPASRVDRADRYARLLLERTDSLSGQLHVEVDTEVEKDTGFETLLRAQLARWGFSLRARPADLRVLYAVSHREHKAGDGVEVVYDADLQLTDGAGVPFARYRLEAEGRGLSGKLAETEAMTALSRSTVEKLLDYLLLEYRMPRPCDREED